MRAVNPNAQPEVQRVLDYLEENRGNRLILGQHTQTMEQPELEHIRRITGKLPALCGFELLGYSPNIRPEDSGEECMTEVVNARGTLRKHGNGQGSADLSPSPGTGFPRWAAATSLSIPRTRISALQEPLSPELRKTRHF